MLSTCNRTEIYVVAERFHGAYADVRNFLAELAFLPPEDFGDHLYVHYDEAAVAHLFAVAAGLDSAVVGEAEILGQVRDAWERAQDEGAAGPQLNLLFRHALEVGKRARTETGIARDIASVSHGRGRHGRRAARRRSTAAACSCSVPATWARAWRVAAGRRRRRRRRASPTAPGTGRGARRARRRPGGPLGDLGDALAEVDLLLTVDRRASRCCSSTPTSSR